MQPGREKRSPSGPEQDERPLSPIVTIHPTGSRIAPGAGDLPTTSRRKMHLP